MIDSLRIAIAQLNPTVGDLEGNFELLGKAHMRAVEDRADILIASELVSVGYPPEDLVLKDAFQRDNASRLRDLARLTESAAAGRPPAILLGTPWVADGRLYNAVALLDDGAVQAVRYKHHLPNYGVFDEKRIFRAGPLSGPMDFRGTRLGVMICEDMWSGEVTERLEKAGAEILIVINGSPYDEDKRDQRLSYASARVVESGLPLIYVNQVGGQDELVFDGLSFVLNANRRPARQLAAWRSEVVSSDWSRGSGGGWQCAPGDIEKPLEGPALTYRAMMLGLHDYVDKNRFPGVIIGLSGGVDSALSAAVAVDALGADRVHAVMMPSRFTSPESLTDASECARLLGIKLDTVSIESMVAASQAALDPVFAGYEPDTTEENIQARVRAIILMAMSNKFGAMLLSTGNKSEMSVGYTTLYGDLCGGYSVLKDVYKTDVYAISAWRNGAMPVGALGPAGPVIPVNILEKPPSAELRPDQTDQDSLPPYDVLDAILRALVEEEKAVSEIVAAGHAAETVARIERMLYGAEYKRRQAPPGVKLTSRNFGRDRRYPITNGFRDARRGDNRGRGE